MKHPSNDRNTSIPTPGIRSDRPTESREILMTVRKNIPGEKKFGRRRVVQEEYEV